MFPIRQPNPLSRRFLRTAVTLICVQLTMSCKPQPNSGSIAPTSSKVKSAVPALKSNPEAAYPEPFKAWLTASSDNAAQFEAFKAYLAREGVSDVLPAWQLIQAETPEAAAKCQIAGFAMPPQSMWPTIVPTLRLVRQEIVPLLGQVKVLSSFRTNEANRCSAGAPESPHKRYSALDLAMVDPIPQKEMFAKLCKHWFSLSPSWGYGLGAYYVRGYPAYNEEGRFHVDTLGRRTWGYSYGAYTSHCRELGYIKVKSPEQIKLEEEAKLKAEADALVKVEAEAKAKLEAEAKAKTEAAAKAKVDAANLAKARETARLKSLEQAKLTDDKKVESPVPTDMTKLPKADPPPEKAKLP
jgi:hypothetical protein